MPEKCSERQRLGRARLYAGKMISQSPLCQRKDGLLTRLFDLSELHFKLTSQFMHNGDRGEGLKEQAAEIHASWKVLKAELTSHRAEHGC